VVVDHAGGPRPLQDETFARGLAGWERFLIRDGDRLRPEACQSPIWDTALSVLALRSAGVPADDRRLQAAGSWLLGEEVTVRGDWAIRRPDLAPGGWSFEFDNDLYPDIDDTVVVALALRELDLGDDAVRRGLDWTVGSSRAAGDGVPSMRTTGVVALAPICDFGKVTDEPAADVTAHALEALGREPGYDSATASGLEWLLAEQEPDGSWFGRWGVNHVYGTGAAVPALEACGVPPGHPAVRRALAWLDSVQKPSGAFGEDIVSASDPARPAPTPSQTAGAAGIRGGEPRRACPRSAQPVSLPDSAFQR
jgi:squalene-hopene/tetraprenyl-beta-curcumene cyclase